MVFSKVPVNTCALKILLLICILGCAMSGLSPARAQSAAEWLTSSGDAARDSWQRSESKFTPKNVCKIKLLWQLKVAAKTMGMQSFREPLIVSGVKTAKGAQTLAIL